jgi:hypothetical protein
MVDAWDQLTGQTGDGTNPKAWHDKNYSDAMMRVKFAIEKVNVLRGISWEMAANVEDESLDLLYIDCCHTYECVTKDLQAWFPKLKRGGVCAGHDYINNAYGVFEAVRDFTAGNYAVHIIPENKNEDAGFYFIK